VDTNIEFLDELHRLPGNPRAPIAFTSRIEIYEDRGVLHPVDSFTHHDFDDDDESSVYDRVVFDVESGPGGDVYVGVENVTEGQHRILQFTYEGEFVRSIELPDDESAFPDETLLPIRWASTCCPTEVFWWPATIATRL